jgi:uncharacterized protein (DUF1501 family)
MRLLADGGVHARRVSRIRVGGRVRSTGAGGKIDQASAALVQDLKQRGMLEDTLVIWGGEFGRTPMVESNVVLGRNKGRDHHPQAFTVGLAGGGIKRGITLGRTDDLGFHIRKAVTMDLSSRKDYKAVQSETFSDRRRDRSVK